MNMIMAAVALRLRVTGSRMAMVEAGAMPGRAAPPLAAQTTAPRGRQVERLYDHREAFTEEPERLHGRLETPRATRQRHLQPQREEQVEEKRQPDSGEHRGPPPTAEDASKSR